jgi:hypothetical protein
MHLNTTTYEALDAIEAAANQAREDYRLLGWPTQEREVDARLDNLLAAAWQLEEHFAGLGLTTDDEDQDDH